MSYNADLYARVLANLPSQYHYGPNILLLFAGSWAPEFQAIEDDIRDLKIQFDWTTATGVWLDAWGRLAQLPRPTAEGSEYEDDELYRQAIAARFASMRSFGGADPILAVIQALLPDSTQGIWELPPYAAQVSIFDVVMSAEERAIASEVIYAAAKLGISLCATVEIPGDESFAQCLDVPNRTAARNERARGTFSVPVHELFMDRIRSGVYTMRSFGLGVV